MNRQEKELMVKNIKDEFQNSVSSFVVGVKGMTVGAIQGLRKDLRSKGAKLKVTKNTLLKLAVQDIKGADELDPYFNNQIAVVFGTQEDIPEIAKILFSTSKTNDKLTLVAGTINQEVIGRSKIEFLASLPPKEVLQAQVCGTLQAPIRGFVGSLNQVILKLVWVLKKIEESRPQ